MLRFHDNPSFEKMPKNRCSGAWIMDFLLLVHGILLWRLEFELELCKKVHAPANKTKKCKKKPTLLPF